jgi:2-polyprenyl-3-methyl-5-hydroxy-6-metoxy-1,4-benzoquinol methylase
MKVILAATWKPRGELPRLERLLPHLQQAYSGIVICLPDHAESQAAAEIAGRRADSQFPLRLLFSQDWTHGRYQALAAALEMPGEWLHYADLDRLLRWVETRPQEWLGALQAIQDCDCLVMGRSAAAYATHPQALLATEAISNQVVSFLLGRQMDVSAGSKGFSRPAAQYLIANTRPGQALGTDAEWPLLLHRAGYRVAYLEVDGLDWESADQGQNQAAGQAEQRQAAEHYDLRPEHWAWRVQVAQEIVEVALRSAKAIIPDHRPLPTQPEDTQPRFDFDAVFDAADYMYFYREFLTDEAADHQVQFMVQFLGLQSPLRILDLACGFGRHANRLAALGHQVTGLDLSPAFLELARQEAAQRGVQATYRQGDMRQLDEQEQYDRVLLMFTAFGYFSDQENALVLRNIQRALKPGGLFLMDLHNRDVILRGFQSDHVTEIDGNFMLDRSSFDSQTGRLVNRRVVIRDGLRRDKPFFLRLYNPSEMQNELQLAGFSKTQFFSDWDGNPLNIDSRRMIVLATR